MPPRTQAPEDPNTEPAKLADYNLGDGEAHFSVDRDANLMPRCAKSGFASKEDTPPQTLLGMYKEACAKAGNCVALQVERPCPTNKTPKSTDEGWAKWTYTEAFKQAQQFSKAAMSVGTEQFDSVGVYGFNSPEWILSFWGAVFAGAKAVGIYPTDTAKQVAFKLAHSNARVVVLEGAKKVKMVESELGSMPNLNAVVVWGEAKPCEAIGGGGDDGFPQSDRSVPVYTWEEFLALSKDTTDADLEERMGAMEPGHCACVVYTSGTTGNPKGVMLTHDNLQFQAQIVRNVSLRDVTVKHGRSLSYLPLSHIAGTLMDIVYPVAMCAAGRTHTCYFARPYDLKESLIIERLKYVRPTIFLGVPRVYEKVMEKLQAIGATVTGLKKKLSEAAKSRNKAAAIAGQVGGTGATTCLGNFLNKKVSAKVRGLLGLDKCELFITGAAPMAPHVYEYWGSLGIRILECYGMSESTGLSTANSSDCYLWGTVGYPCEAVEVKVFKIDDEDFNVKKECPPAKDFSRPTEEEQGEICFRGRTVMMGYLSNPDMDFTDEDGNVTHTGDVDEIFEKTAGTIDSEGWLHSGDKGTRGTHGMIKITGRYKELIIGSGGENIAPVPIEDSVKKLCPGIANAMMVGDKQKYNVMLVTLKCKGATGELPGTDQLDGPALKIGTAKTIAEAKKDEAWKAAIQSAIDQTNSNPVICASPPWKVQKWVILDRDFSVETGELTATLKLKRSEACKHFADEIDALYA
jgi:long-chain-fatty-acid--CoA ligase ACSBG